MIVVLYVRFGRWCCGGNVQVMMVILCWARLDAVVCGCDIHG